MNRNNTPRPFALAALAFGLAAVTHPPSIAAQQTAEADRTVASDTELLRWHQDLKTYAPVESGCFTAAYPRVDWKRVDCGPVPAFVSGRRPNQADHTSSGVERAQVGRGAQTTGNGNDYVAQTAGITRQGLGTFPTVKNVTSEKGKGVSAFGGGGLLGSNEYSLQLNTDITQNAAACSAFGYSSCYVWEQFVYSTAYRNYPAEIFIQNWVFPSQSDYSNRGCPSGWQDASSSGSPACYKNSAATTVPNVSPTKLASTKLSGSVSGGKDTLVFTSGTTAYSTSEPDSTVNVGAWWKQSEFNVVGNAGGSEAVFNSGASITVNLAVTDGSTSAPTCVSQAGTTGETNNLTLGSCKATGGASPSITFTESD